MHSNIFYIQNLIKYLSDICHWKFSTKFAVLLCEIAQTNDFDWQIMMIFT